MPTASELKLFQTLAGDSVDIDAFQSDPQNQFPTQPSPEVRQDAADRRSEHTTRHDDTSSVTHARHQHHNQNEFDDHSDPHDGHPPAQYQTMNNNNNNTNTGEPSSQTYDEYKETFGNSIASKRAALYELRQLTQLHPDLKTPGARQFTMDDDMSSIIYEIERLRSVLDIQSNLGLLTSGLSFGVLGIEVLSSKLKLFSLEGWSNDISKNMQSFRPVLLKIYRRVFRKGIGSVNPFLELTLALVTSAFTYNRKRNALNAMPQAPTYQPSFSQQNDSAQYTQASQAQTSGMQFNDFDDDDDEMQGPTQTPSMMGAPSGSPSAGIGGSGGGMMSTLLPMLMGYGGV